MSTKEGVVTVKMEPLVIDLGPDTFIDEPTKAMAEVVKDSIRRQPDNKWNKTGKLLSGIRVESSAVVGPNDRLSRDEVAEKFNEEVLPDRVTDEKKVKDAINLAIDQALGVKK
jgi:hypothetical protein